MVVLKISKQIKIRQVIHKVFIYPNYNCPSAVSLKVIQRFLEMRRQIQLTP